ncbi:hypothetical protein NPIL_41381 [Nephila pilipes]|uniref:Uncharacterized protein n=1 Tax=Nephila pilipes TaxID=299642 RepID=A0A8X6Q4M9_NEPPI|nr:hypothetical protein NPIL_41381 [Nephila pilipes]
MRDSYFQTKAYPNGTVIPINLLSLVKPPLSSIPSAERSISCNSENHGKALPNDFSPSSSLYSRPPSKKRSRSFCKICKWLSFVSSIWFREDGTKVGGGGLDAG